MTTTRTGAGVEPENTEATFGTLTVPAAYEHVVQRIRRSIQLSEVLPGEKLPSERALAESFGVSRLTVREALRILQGERIIETRRGNGGGTFVLPDAGDGISLSEGRAAALQRVQDVHELRLAVEPMAAFLAADRATPDQIQRLRTFQDSLNSSTTVGSFRRADSGFHLAIGEASGNEMLRQTIEDARSAMFLVLDARQFTIIHSTSSSAHSDILDAIVARDPALAAEQMRTHILEAKVEITDALARSFDARSSPTDDPTTPSR